MKTIGFTGHRDKVATITELEAIHAMHPNSTWVHGGAVGFDSQVAAFASAHNIPQIVIPPDYAKHGRSAPLIRNRQIVDQSEMLIACYDGRQSGGTFHAIKYAQKRILVHVLSQIQNQEEQLIAATSR